MTRSVVVLYALLLSVTTTKTITTEAWSSSPFAAFTPVTFSGSRHVPSLSPWTRRHVSSSGRRSFLRHVRPHEEAATAGVGGVVIAVPTLLHAGGFEWEDPTSESMDQGVENPYKNPELMKASAEGDQEGMKIDPARLLAPRLQGSNLYLIGMMGTGKSTVGDIVARRMGTYNFLDTDDIIEKATGMTIPEIFKAEGEDGFRQVEAQILDSVHAYIRCVVSTGGGIVCRLSNWSKLQTGITIWLDVEPELIMKRIAGTDRPLLQTEDPLQTLKDLLDERKPRYSQADVHIKVTEDMTEKDTADKIIRDLHYFIDENPPAWKKAKAKAQAEGLDWV